MTLLHAVRWLAYAVAFAAIIDPSWRIHRPAPLTIAVREPEGALAASVGSTPGTILRARLESAMPGTVAINTPAAPRALVVAGSTLDAKALPASGPVSFVLDPEKRATARVISLVSPNPVLPGWTAVLTAGVEGRAMTPGSSSPIVLESNGIEVDRVEHRWTRADERFTVSLAFAPPAAGSFPMTVRVGDGAPVPARVLAEDRKLKILAFDPRPSWASGFVRRALEAAPAFDLAARVRASRGLDVRTGAPPMTLSAESLAPFDLVIAGAPEELTPQEVAALSAFARTRGGAVVLVADRKPRGPYLGLVGVDVFDEALLERPLRLVAGDGTNLRASEFAYPRTLPVGSDPLLAFPQGNRSGAPLVSIPLGAGRIVFSGLMDAWRYRDDNDAAFGAFWRSEIGREAIRAPRRLEITLEPAAATAGSLVRLRAAVRATDLTVSGDHVAIPGIRADVIDGRGRQAVVRLWPADEAGKFEGTFLAPPAGRYDVRVQTDAGTSADSPFLVSEGPPLARPPGGANPAGTIARATGGIVATAENIAPLLEHLRRLERERVPGVQHPTRSPWWAVVFGALLSTEWLTRRRRGLR